MRLALTLLIAVMLAVCVVWSSLQAQSCQVCRGAVTFICSGGGQPVCQNGTWVCGSGTQCNIPPPDWTHSCASGSYCSGSGWTCSCGPTGCGSYCPIILDTANKGFHLTDVAHGVGFPFVPGKPPVKMSWTDAAFGNGFLVLDRNGNGIIDDGTELFGNLTPQPASENPNGYLALAVFDQPGFGGNGDGVIDARDAVYNRLRVWIDANQNGISDPGELHTLPELGILRIDLKYRYSRRVDEYGNEFRYHGKIWDKTATDRDTSYDVFFQHLNVGP